MFIVNEDFTPVLKPHGKSFSWHADNVEEEQVEIKVARKGLHAVTDTIHDQTKGSPEIVK